MKYGFDNKKYLKIQSEHIRERISRFGDKLYMEFGGKLFDDFHAARILPGFEPDSKFQMLQQMVNEVEIVIVISAVDIERNKVRGDLGITYDMDVLRLHNEFESRGFLVGSVVITHYNGQSSADNYREKLQRMGIKVYYHHTIEGYPNNVALIDSEDGFGRNDYVETSRPLVVITAPGPGSGKMAVCLSQLYQDFKRGIKAGYAKFETFPIWNLSLKHPLNLAYEAATADLNDVNMIDPFHLEAYGELAVNYNRDVEIFPVLNTLFEGIYGENPYKSPTDMGVNMIGNCMCDEQVCCDAACDEIVRRYYTALCKLASGGCNDHEVNKIGIIMKQAKITTDFRKCSVAAHSRRDHSGVPSAAIELQDGTLISSETSSLLGPCAALLMNAAKHIAGIPHEIKLIPQEMIEPIQHSKVDILHGHNPRLHTDEVLVALSLLSTKDPNCKKALDALTKLSGCQAHCTTMISDVDSRTFKRLGCNVTCDPCTDKE